MGPRNHGGSLTMADIGRAARVSASTVSRVLNDASTAVPIAQATRERVIGAAHELGYRPNPHARSLRGAPTMLLGVVVRDFSDPFFAVAVETFALEAMTHGYSVVLGHAGGRTDQGAALPAIFDARRTDAVVLLGDMQDQSRLLADLRDSLVPVVALWQGVSPIEFPTVQVDDAAGIVLAVDHLRALGHERIGCIGALLPGDNRRRDQSYLDQMIDAGLQVPNGYLQRVDNSFGGGEVGLASLVELGDPPTAIVATTDLVAVGAMHAAQRLRYRVPDDLSVVGFDDLPMAAYTTPTLTTIRMPVTEMVAEAVGLAIGFAQHRDWPRRPEVRVFQPSLLHRESSARRHA